MLSDARIKDNGKIRQGKGWITKTLIKGSAPVAKILGIPI